jgi:uncharacterized Zn finger protein
MHVAAALYGVGARLDEEPELLFALRRVDPLELVASASAATVAGAGTEGGRRIDDDKDLAALFGIEVEAPAPPRRPRGTARVAGHARSRAKTRRAARRKKRRID